VPQLLVAAVVVKMALLRTARARALRSRHQDKKVSLVATLKGAEDNRGPLNGDPIFGSQVRIAQKQLLIDGPCDLCQEFAMDEQSLAPQGATISSGSGGFAKPLQRDAIHPLYGTGYVHFTYAGRERTRN
jgi:hypothetical protein